MARQFKLPEIGEGIDSGKVLQILVSEGDTIHEGDSVVEIESDKATAEVPANQGGLVTKVHIAEGDTINVGDLILSVEAEQQTPENGGSGKAQSRPQPKPGANSSDEEEKDKKSEVDSGDKKNSGKTIEFALPPLGEGVEEAKVISIAVKAGRVSRLATH